jgi:hypothetical protein
MFGCCCHGTTTVLVYRSRALAIWGLPREDCSWCRMLWGRGTIDMKSAVIALLEALSELHGRGYKPMRTIFMGIGHDEEIGGPHGAAALAQHMRQRNKKLAIVWDEGMVVLSDGLGGLIKQPVALIGTAEKVTLLHRLGRCAEPCLSFFTAYCFLTAYT